MSTPTISSTTVNIEMITPMEPMEEEKVQKVVQIAASDTAIKVTTFIGKTRTRASTGRRRSLPFKKTSIFLEEQRLRVSLLELFEMWDTNDDQVLTTMELAYGIRVADITLDANILRTVIEFVADSTKDSLTTNELEAHAHHFLDNQGFLNAMLHEHVLGKLPVQAALIKVEKLKKLMSKDSKLFEIMHELRKKQPLLIETARKEKDIAWDKTVRQVSMIQDQQEAKAAQKRKEPTLRKRSSLTVEMYENSQHPMILKCKNCFAKWYVVFDFFDF